MKTLRKNVFECYIKNQLKFDLEVTERNNHSFYCLFDESRFSDICTIMELKELNNLLCKHLKSVRSSQPCISMNFCTEFSKKQDL